MRRDAGRTVSGGGAPGRAGAKGSLRDYRGDGFTVKVPSGWVDRTIHSLAGPPDRDFVPGIWISVDADPGTPDLGDYSDARVQTILETMSGSRLALKKKVTLPGGQTAVRAEIRWFPSDEQRLYQRLLCLLEGGEGFNLSAQMTKRARQTRGPAINRIMESIQLGGGPAAGGRKGEGVAYQADRFTVVLEEGWRAETVHILMEPRDGGFRRTVLLRRDALPDKDLRDEQVFEAELEALSGSVPGFELLEKEPVELPDGGGGFHVRFRRKTPKEGHVLQDQVLAVRAAQLLSLTATMEENPPAEERALMDSCLKSLTPLK